MPFDEQVLRAVFGRVPAGVLSYRSGGERRNDAQDFVLSEFILLKPEPNGKILEEKRLEKEDQATYGTPKGDSRKPTSRQATTSPQVPVHR
ncbi:MAG: hypothetical protein AW08_02792 [Candidatus Accumulibacter adjunctus]|uniref:Uncharacterized protein n=1 Tax=Candidatus Accumulibacter adjunctus TaxID=1454001 RepID=A0A011M8N7_9PROT|nr:MAG: hypothetical protein AW08_02792 [Candidatus Accumulibacter adjunctus]